MATRTYINKKGETKTYNYDYNKDKVKEAKQKIKELENKIKANSDIAHTINLDKKNRKTNEEKQVLEKKYKYILEENELLQKQLEVYNNLANSEYKELEICVRDSVKTESTAILCLSDFHIEENVKAEQVNGLNSYNLKEAEKRCIKLFENSLKMINHFEAETQIPVIILALLGDFISGYIHEELQAVNEVNPVLATMKARDFLRSGIQFLLDNSNKDLIVPCSVGNHGRGSKEKRAGQYNYSYEYMMYKTLELDFNNNPRVKFQISESYHNYVKVYGQTLRFSHGDNIKGGAGIGGITIPINNSIKRWNMTKQADIDIFGHFHQSLQGKNFIVNGSLIGATPYGIQFGNEEPQQTLFLINNKYGKTIYCPIFVK